MTNNVNVWACPELTLLLSLQQSRFIVFRKERKPTNETLFSPYSSDKNNLCSRKKNLNSCAIRDSIRTMVVWIVEQLDLAVQAGANRVKRLDQVLRRLGLGALAYQ